MILIYCAIAVALFAYVCRKVRLISTASDATHVAREAVRTVTNPDLADDEKEVLVRKSALHLLTASVSILVRGAMALVAAIAPLWLLDVAGIAAYRETMACLLSWPFILAVTVVGLVVTRLPFNDKQQDGSEG